jgi:hypothetical protein
MVNWTVAGAASAAALLLILVWIVRLCVPARGAIRPGPEWVRRFDARRYSPVNRLLSGEDLEFLPVAPGYSTEIERRLRAARRKALAGYLQWMKADFDRLYLAGKAAIAEAETDQSDLLASLVRMRAVFLWRYTLAMGRLSLSWAGAGLPDARSLAESVARMGSTVGTLAPFGARS